MRVALQNKTHTALAEVSGLCEKTVLLMPLDQLEGIGPGCLGAANWQIIDGKNR